ncbi:MAG: hypothetical protein KAJ47_02585, partial [Candidatus Aenigmarchaeota archaeon]|nr:hypothetical protein [Candidatus Aenigmarchaeota archaeon]
MNNARIFISCGQQQNEREIGLKIYDKFKGKYRLYFAENIHTPEGIENIFKALMKSEYFIGINFKRDSSNFGSLFVQQELAIASFLKLRLRFFQEEGIKWSG